MGEGFRDACRVELEGRADLIRFLSAQSDDGKVLIVDKGRLVRDFQLVYGDALIQRNGTMYAVEFKIEQRWTGNLFIETWSNRSLYRRGWLDHLDTDLLLYYFQGCQRLVVLNFQRLKEWAYHCGNIYKFHEAQQCKYEQRNDTWGRIVPVNTLQEQCGAKVYELQDNAVAC